MTVEASISRVDAFFIKT